MTEDKNVPKTWCYIERPGGNLDHGYSYEEAADIVSREIALGGLAQVRLKDTNEVVYPPAQYRSPANVQLPG